MQPLLKSELGNKIPKYQQIVEAIIMKIRLGALKKGDLVFSINEMSDEHLLSRDTVQKAYSLLKRKGIIKSVKGIGFYINRTDISTPFRILLLFNKISNYKKIIYNAFVQTMGNKAVVDLKIHHSSTQVFQSLINEYVDDYDYFVIMPHFYHDEDEIHSIIKKIPNDRLIILDKDLSHSYFKYAGVYQDFKNDIAEALEGAISLIRKYKKLILVFPQIIPYPKEIVIGFRSFCCNHNIPYSIIDEIRAGTAPLINEAYIVIEESDLVTLVKNCQKNKLTVGKDIGIISYNETPLKEILLEGITVISTDHYQMGVSAATLILDNKKEKIKNPFALIRRNSL